MSPYRTTDDELLRALRERMVELLDTEERGTELDSVGASADEIAETESQLGFPLPPLLRRVYEIAAGGFGPGLEGLLPIGDGEDTLAGVYRARLPARRDAPETREPGFDRQPWPRYLLPLCDWGCATWSCLDCRSADGPIVTASGGEPFANTGHTLRSWLSAWLEGVDLYEEMFEPGPDRTGINQFTRALVVMKGQGKPKGPRWP